MASESNRTFPSVTNRPGAATFPCHTVALVACTSSMGRSFFASKTSASASSFVRSGVPGRGVVRATVAGASIFAEGGSANTAAINRSESSSSESSALGLMDFGASTPPCSDFGTTAAGADSGTSPTSCDIFSGGCGSVLAL